MLNRIEYIKKQGNKTRESVELSALRITITQMQREGKNEKYVTEQG